MPSPTINSLCQTDKFVTIDKSALIHYHPKSVIYIRVHFWSIGFDKCVMSCVCHYSIIQNSVSALKIFCALHIHLSLLQNA